jgi:methylamine utilization protein MauE
MLGPLAIVAPVVMAAVLFASAIGKLRHPDDLAGWSEIGVPRPLRKEWIRQAHPWGELALGVALIVLGGVLGLLAALVALALMAAYLWLVWRAVARADDASCACFGVRKRVTKVTVVRNAWLTLLAAVTASVIWTTPTFGGALAAATIISAWVWLLATAIAVVTALLVVWPEGGEEEPVLAAPVYERGADDDEELDYVRTRTPAVPLTLADGTAVNLRSLTGRPLLLLSVSSTCGGCEPVIERVGEWRELLPEVDIRLLLFFPPEVDTLTERTEPQSLHDPNGYLSESLSDHWMTPTAVLFGIDGLLAGGPVVGYLPITEFISEIDESLHSIPVE